jgi:hypothetical protein
MELASVPRDVTYSIEELRALAEICVSRLPIREAEAKRAARMRSVVAAAADLGRVLSAHTHSMLVNCQGSHGNSNLARETEELHVALARYAEVVRGLAKDHRRLLDAQSAAADQARDGAGAHNRERRRAV